MKKALTKVKAKINLTLDVYNNYGGYHNIESLVTTIDLYDKITIKRRDDKNIFLIQKGIVVDKPIEENNAVKAVKRFMEKYNTNGADIIIDKNIPLGGGLGGSSADIAGAIQGMQKVYGTNYNLEEICNELGSDVSYMLRGGYAFIEGRGEKITSLDIPVKFYFILLTDSQIITAKESYDKFDELYEDNIKKESVSKKCLGYLKNGKLNEFVALAENDLYIPSSLIYDKIKYNIKLLEKENIKKAMMTGSGATTYAIFFSKKERDKVYRNLLKIVGKKNLIKAQSK